MVVRPQRDDILDFSLLPDIHYAHFFFTVDPEWLRPIQSLRRTVERVQNAVRFAWYSAGSADIMHCAEADAASFREGFLRAALAGRGVAPGRAGPFAGRLGAAERAASFFAGGAAGDL